MTEQIFRIPVSPDEVPAAPRQPSSSAESLLLRFQGRFRVLLGLGLGLLPVGIITFLIVGQGLWEDLSIDLNPTVIQGTLYNPTPGAPLPIKPPHPFCLFYDYQYQGQAYRGESCVMDLSLASHSDKTLLQPGEPVSLEVSTTTPSSSRVKGSRKAYLGYSGAMLSFFPLLALWLIASSLTGHRRVRYAFVYGTPCLATITNRLGENNLDGKPMVRMHWTYNVNNTEYSGSCALPDTEALRPLFLQDHVVLVVHPKKPDIHSLYLG